MIESYPLFVPPESVSAKPRTLWNKREAEAYKEWVINNLEDRVRNFLAYIEEPFYETYAPGCLLGVGGKVASLIKTDYFSTDSGERPQLNNYGYAICADMGLFTAKLILIHCLGRVKWVIARTSKSDALYNLPVLAGFGLQYLDPVGGSIAEGTGILLGTRKNDAWNKIFEYWTARAC